MLNKTTWKAWKLQKHLSGHDFDTTFDTFDNIEQIKQAAWGYKKVKTVMSSFRERSYPKDEIKKVLKETWSQYYA